MLGTTSSLAIPRRPHLGNLFLPLSCCPRLTSRSDQLYSWYESCRLDSERPLREGRAPQTTGTKIPQQPVCRRH